MPQARDSSRHKLKARIIIIDDDDALRDTLVRILTEAGHTVAATVNGFEGVELFRAEPADLILTDIMMPYGGLPTIRVLRGDYPNLKIIAMSGGGQPRLDIAGGLGANHVREAVLDAATHRGDQ